VATGGRSYQVQPPVRYGLRRKISVLDLGPRPEGFFLYTKEDQALADKEEAGSEEGTEIAKRICVYNLRQLVYLKYTRGIDQSMKWLPTVRPVILGYLTH